MQKAWNSIDWKGLKRSAVKARQSTASSMKNWVMTDIENLTREVTADTTWGASGTQLDEVARATYNRDDYALIMGIVWQRLTSRRWRCVYKGLELLKHMMFHGSSRVVDEARDAKYHIHALEGFRYIDSQTGKDEGQNVRTKAKEVYDLIDNPKLLDEEREKSKALKAKMGVSAPSSFGGYGDSGGYGYGENRTGASQSYAYQYDEELDGPMQGADGNVEQQSAPATVVPAPTADDLLELGDEPYTAAAGAPQNEPTVEFFDNDEDDAFNPRAPAALPAPGDAPLDPLDSLLGGGSTSPAALGAPPAPLQIEPSRAPGASLSADIFGGISDKPGPSPKAEGPNAPTSTIPDPFAPVAQSSSPTGMAAGGGGTKSGPAGQIGKRAISSNKATGGGGLDAFDGLLDLSNMAISNTNDKATTAQPSTSDASNSALDSFF